MQRRLKAKPEVFWALRDISFEVEPGESVALIGANGSGKSTLLKLVGRIIEPTKGAIKTHGRIIGLLELGTGFHPDLTGRENIFLNASILGIPRHEIKQRLDEVIDFADIGPFIDVQVRNYSSGMVVRLGFAVTTALEPEILLIDEVLAVGDQSFQEKCIRRLEDLRANGVTVLFVSHSMGQAQQLCRRAIWISHGEVQLDDDIDVVAGKYQDAQASAQTLRLEPQVEVANPNRWGTYLAEITEVELLAADGAAPPFFKTGDFFCIRIHYVAHTRIEAPTFGVAIYTKGDVHVNGPNSVREGYEIPYIEGTGYVDYVVEHLPLNQGSYELTAAIYDHESKAAYDHQHRLHPLEVRAPGIWGEEGIVHVTAQWRHTAETGNLALVAR